MLRVVVNASVFGPFSRDLVHEPEKPDESPLPEPCSQTSLPPVKAVAHETAPFTRTQKDMCPLGAMEMFLMAASLAPEQLKISPSTLQDVPGCLGSAQIPSMFHMAGTFRNSGRWHLPGTSEHLTQRSPVFQCSAPVLVRFAYRRGMPRASTTVSKPLLSNRVIFASDVPSHCTVSPEMVKMSPPGFASVVHMPSNSQATPPQQASVT